MTTDGDDNIASIRASVADAIEQIKALNADAQEFTNAKSIVVAKLVALGIPKAAFDQAMRYLGWDEEKRQGFDLAYRIVREAGGAPIRPDLFNAIAIETNRAHSEALTSLLGRNDLSDDQREAIGAAIIILTPTPL